MADKFRSHSFNTNIFKDAPRSGSKEHFQSAEGIEIKEVYESRDIENLEYLSYVR